MPKFDKSLEIVELRLKDNTALFWGEDCEDVKVFEDVDKETFDKMYSLNEENVAFRGGDNDDEMFEILFDMDYERAYELIEMYYEEWGKHIEIVNP